MSRANSPYRVTSDGDSETCPKCKGSGVESWEIEGTKGAYFCEKCKGLGRVPKSTHPLERLFKAGFRRAARG